MAGQLLSSRSQDAIDFIEDEIRGAKALESRLECS
jgi:hypothetical protein